MPKLWIVSDLHLEHGAIMPAVPKCDIAVLAGDIDSHDEISLTLNSLLVNYEDLEIVYVPGNHEYYGASMSNVDRILANIVDTRLHILKSGSAATVCGIKFCGGTLWTDYDNFNPLAVIECKTGMNDYAQIWNNGHKVLPDELFKIHCETLTRIENEKDVDVVVSHHAPCNLSQEQQYKTSRIAAAFSSNLSETIFKMNPKLWIHGHCHNSSDYTIGNTRILCNPKGYPFERNPGFDSTLVIDI